MNGRILRAVVGTVVALGVGLGAPMAAAQGGGFGGFGGQDMGPSVTARSLETYGDLVGMDDGQRELATALFESYRDEIRGEQQKLREAMEDARATFEQTQDREAFEGVREQAEAVRARRAELEATFFSDLKSLLTPEQAQQWPKVERAHRRLTTIDRGLMSGERVDLIQIAEDLEVADQPQVGEALAAYEVELDQALTHRNKVIEEAFGQVRELFQEGDEAKIERMFDNARSASKQVRDLNRRYTDQLAALLPAEKSQAFRSAVQERALPRVYRPTHAQRSVEAALGFGDLTEEQKSAVQALRARYQAEAAPLNTQLAREIEKAEEEADARTFMRMQFARGGDRGRGGRGRGGDDDGTRELMEKRRDLDRQTLNLLSEALTEDQIQRLPRPEAQGEGDRGRRGGGQRGRDIN